MTDYEYVVSLTDRLSLVEKARLLEYLSAGFKRDLEQEAFRQIQRHPFAGKYLKPTDVL